MKSPPSSNLIAALFVAEDGPYIGQPGIEPWTEKHDARNYPGPMPAVAHPPCQRWGRFAEGSPSDKRFKIGDDAGCFSAAVLAVRTYGGVLEHPQGSYAWQWFGMPTPSGRGWTRPDAFGGRSCYVDQGAYGHRAKKPTWLYAVLPAYPRMDWTRVWGRPRIGGDGFHSAQERARGKARSDYKPVENLGKRERVLTPEPFRDVLVELARSCIGWTPQPSRLIQAVLA